MLLSKQGNSEEAVSQLEAAEREFEKLIAEDSEKPEFVAGMAMTKTNIANVLISSGNNGAAITLAQEAMELYRTLVDRFPDRPPYLESLATTRLNLAAAYRTSGRDRDELSMYTAALGDYDLLLTSRPDVPLYRERVAATERELAMYLNALGDNQAALEAITKSIEITDALLNSQVPLARYHEEWAAEQATLGRILSDLGHEDEAILHIGDAVERLDLLIESDPDFATGYESQRAACWSVLGTIYQKSSDYDAALATLNQAAASFGLLADANPGNTSYSNGLAWTYSYLADLGWQMEDQAAASGYFEQAVQLRMTLKDQPEFLNNLARLIVSCRDPMLVSGDVAIEAARQATVVAPENARFLSTLGSAYAQFGRYDESIEALGSVEKLGPRGGSTHEFWLAFALAKRNAEGDLDEARNRFQQAVTRMELNAPGRTQLVRLRTLVEPMLANPGTSANSD